MKTLALIATVFLLLSVFFAKDAGAYLMQRGHVSERLHEKSGEEDEYMVGRDYVEWAIDNELMQLRYGEFYREYSEVDPVEEKRIHHKASYGENPIYLKVELGSVDRPEEPTENNDDTELPVTSGSSPRR